MKEHWKGMQSLILLQCSILSTQGFVHKCDYALFTNIIGLLLMETDKLHAVNDRIEINPFTLLFAQTSFAA
ncbi:hypothetical protein JCM10914A_01340 [Paenibacillus sp. JCM 10914]